MIARSELGNGSRRDRATVRWDFWILLLVALGLRLVSLDKSLGRDEIVSIFSIRLGWGELVPYTLAYNSHPPLLAVLLHLWTTISSSVWWGRFLIVLLGVGVCGWVYAIGREYRDRAAGLQAMLFATVAPAFVWGSQYLRGYMLYTFFSAASVYTMLRLLEGRRDRATWAGYAVVTSLSVYSFYYAGCVWIAQNIYVLISRQRMRSLGSRWWLVQGAVAISLIPLSFLFADQFFGKIISNDLLVQQRGFYVGSIYVGGWVRSFQSVFGLDPLFLFETPLSELLPRSQLVALAGLIFVGILGTLFLALRGSRLTRGNGEENQAGFLIWMVVIPVVIANGVGEVFDVAVAPYYFLFGFVPLAVLLTDVIRAMPHPLLGRCVIVALVCLAMVRVLQLYPMEPDNWKAIAAYVDEVSRPPDCVGTARVGRQPLLFYRTQTFPLMAFGEYYIPGQSTAKSNLLRLRKDLEPCRQIWMIYDAYRFDSSKTFYHQWLVDQGYLRGEEREFKGASVVLYRKNKVGSLLSPDGPTANVRASDSL
ncbi:MAG: glycosyltransferase family 39 protein [bacterium]|nr:glycosyltransferase family 39 protein [bacterium]